MAVPSLSRAGWSFGQPNWRKIGKDGLLPAPPDDNGPPSGTSWACPGESENVMAVRASAATI